MFSSPRCRSHSRLIYRFSLMSFVARVSFVGRLSDAGASATQRDIEIKRKHFPRWRLLPRSAFADFGVALVSLRRSVKNTKNHFCLSIEIIILFCCRFPLSDFVRARSGVCAGEFVTAADRVDVFGCSLPKRRAARELSCCTRGSIMRSEVATIERPPKVEIITTLAPDRTNSMHIDRRRLPFNDYIIFKSTSTEEKATAFLFIIRIRHCFLPNTLVCRVSTALSISKLDLISIESETIKAFHIPSHSEMSKFDERSGASGIPPFTPFIHLPFRSAIRLLRIPTINYSFGI